MGCCVAHKKRKFAGWAAVLPIYRLCDDIGKGQFYRMGWIGISGVLGSLNTGTIILLTWLGS